MCSVPDDIHNPLIEKVRGRGGDNPEFAQRDRGLNIKLDHANSRLEEEGA